MAERGREPFWQSPEAWALVRSRVPCYAIDAIAATAFHAQDWDYRATPTRGSCCWCHAGMLSAGETEARAGAGPNGLALPGSMAKR